MSNLVLAGETIFDAAVEALSAGAQLVEKRAKELAPVRNLFTDTKYSIRYKRASEVEHDRALRTMLGLGPDIAEKMPKTIYDRRSATKATDRYHEITGGRPPRYWLRRSMNPEGSTGGAQWLLQSYQDEMAARKRARKAGEYREAEIPLLSRRGAAEVKSGRAAYLSKVGSVSRMTIGGRLRGEIFSTRAVPNGKRAEAWVISPTKYAKYMEFGTRHAAAHPYLRPALLESRGSIVSLVKAAVANATRTSGGAGAIEIKVRL
jgi:hypothetical protein